MNKKITILFSSVALLIFPVIVFADTTTDPTTWFNGIICRFLTIVVWPVFIGAVIIMAIYAGFLFVTAGGEPSKISAAKNALIFAIIGVIVGILAFSVVGILGQITDVSVANLTCSAPASSGGGSGSCVPSGGSCPGAGGIDCCSGSTCVSSTCSSGGGGGS